MVIEWKPEQTHPVLNLDDGILWIRLQPIEQEYGGKPSIKYQLAVSMTLPYGNVAYSSSFLSLDLDFLKIFSVELKNSYDAPSHSIEFSDLSQQEFVLKIVKQYRSCLVILDLESGGSADVSLTSGFTDRDTLQIWSRRVSEHCALMDQWMIENPPVGPA